MLAIIDNHRNLLFLLLLPHLIHSKASSVDEEWSWGPSGSRASPSTAVKNSNREGRLLFSDDVKARRTRVDIAETRPLTRPSTFTVSGGSGSSRFPIDVQSVQPVDNPNPLPTVLSQTGINRPALGVSIDDSDEEHPSSLPVSLYRPPINGNGDNEHGVVEPGSQDDSEGRFSLGKRLCRMGLGWNCKKYNNRGVEYVNLDYLPYLPSPVHPPQPPHYPSAPSPLPYGGGIESSNVYHVQPVALQPVGSPIQAIPLGPAGGQIPHSPVEVETPLLSTYGAPHPSSLSSYGAQAYGSPVPSFNTPQLHSSFGSSHDSYKVIHDPPVEVQKDGTIIQHIHQHTHVYKDRPSSGGYERPYRDQRLPVVPPHPNSLYYSAGYRDACECVPHYACDRYDIVGRSSESLLDARNNKKAGLIYSNATASEDNDTTTTTTSKTTISATRQKRSTRRFKNILLEAEEVNSHKLYKRDAPRITNAFINNQKRRTVGYSPDRDGCETGDVCCRNPRAGRSDNSFATTSCGRRNPAGVVARVKTPYYEVGDTDFGEYPWQAAILKRDKDDMVYVCGATLFDDQHVITAAHCVHKLKAYDMQVRLGEWDVRNENEYFPHEDYDVDEIVVHPAFEAGLLQNDLAILRIVSRAPLGRYPHIAPVCMPEPHTNFQGMTCFVTGWGKDAFGNSGKFQHVLKKTDVPIVSHSRCEDALRRTRLGSNFVLHSGMICAGGEEGKDACKGDGGGPLVCRGRGGEFQLIGIVSWGIGCGEKGVPGVYADVTHYVDWIRSVTRSF